jgi:hypothetical protein
MLNTTVLSLLLLPFGGETDRSKVQVDPRFLLQLLFSKSSDQRTKKRNILSVEPGEDIAIVAKSQPRFESHMDSTTLGDSGVKKSLHIKSSLGENARIY